jgi:hypothetical protein
MVFTKASLFFRSAHSFSSVLASLVEDGSLA